VAQIDFILIELCQCVLALKLFRRCARVLWEMGYKVESQEVISYCFLFVAKLLVGIHYKKYFEGGFVKVSMI
jgi:hypothetical protein